ncbi:aminotransferase class V-fold PLP-dependent enzyme [Natronosporangium hydrolyticum]|uniref:Aminotransferase class V-fold PLP-dependent enzyme n=2 Tax=Natronosporangium hydrolyticum TaxID=2811111 RepID=A0A895YH96_9ACTN|nr:aminotransferase class V-fold PLP-dependent enzyme [Natronosporangium hydrolyticum]
MTPEDFRAYGHQLVDWVADYWRRLAEQPATLPVQPPVKPGQVAGQLPSKPPAHGEPIEAVLADLDQIITPATTHWQHPGFFGYFPANTSGPSVLGDLISSGLGTQGMLWSTGPAATELETVMLDWLVDLLGLPARFHSHGPGGGVIQDSASSAALVATLAALHRASDGAWRTAGVDRRYTVYTSTEGHSSIEKAVRIAGLGESALRLVEVDPQTLAMRPDALRDQLAADRAAGATPALVVATIGTTSTTAIDPLPQIGEICTQEQVWLHVDAAYAGSAAVCPELRWTHAGVAHADSYCFDPHKWLLTGFDCDAFWVADRAELVAALTVLPEYLRNAATSTGAVIDYRDWQVPLGRRFRALKLWFVLRWYGAEGLRAHIRHGVALAARFADLVRADDRFELVTDHPFALVCFRLRGGDDASNERLLTRLNAAGEVFLTHTRVNGRYTLRLAVGSPHTTEETIDALWRDLRRLAELA